MKRSTPLSVLGVLVLVVSLGAWAVTRPSVQAGDAAPFEQAFTSSPTATRASQGTPATTPTPRDRQLQTDGEEGVTRATIPRFTIGERSAGGHSRVPIGIRIPALGQKASVIPAGVESNGDMEVPDNVRDVSWYKYGSAPGEPGSAVLAAHVDLAVEGPGVFFKLRELEPGSVIYVDFDDGTNEAFRAEARTIYAKDELPTEAIFSREGPPVLTLITCGGGFNERTRRYDSNVVVYAIPLDNASSPRT